MAIPGSPSLRKMSRGLGLGFGSHPSFGGVRRDFPIPEAYYRFDNDLTDFSPNSRDLTDGGVSYNTGRFARAVAAGSASRANDILSGSAYSGTYSVQVWLYLTMGIGSNQGVFFYDNNLDPVFTIHASTGSSRRIDVEWGPNAEQAISIPGLLANTWYNILVSVDKGVGLVYLAGTLVGTVDLSGLAGDFGTDADTVQILFSGPNRVYMDDLVVLSSVLTPAQRQYLVSSPYPIY